MDLLRRLYRDHLARHLRRFGDGYAREAFYGQAFNAAAARLPWLDGEVFFPTGAAANTSLLYLYLRILETARPQRVLEFGLGQSSALARAYARRWPDAAVRVVESDPRWVEIFEARGAGAPNFAVHAAPLVATDLAAYGVPGGAPRRWYESVPAGPFDLVLLDGPGRDDTYARAGILTALPGILAERFVLIIDDCHYEGVRQTAALIRARLRETGHDFVEFGVEGLKTQLCFVSRPLAFLATM